MGLPRRAHRRPDLLPDHELERGPRRLVGPVRDLARRPRHLGRHRRRDAAGIWVLHRRGANIPLFMDCVAPGLLVAQAIGRVGNWFNQELFGGPTSLPWGLEIDRAHRPAGYLNDPTFHPTFLYEIIWNLGLAAFLVWLGHHRRIRPPGLFALYVAGYSLGRIGEELLRVDPAHHIFGLRLNFFVAIALLIVGVVLVHPRPAPPGRAGPAPLPAGDRRARRGRRGALTALPARSRHTDAVGMRVLGRHLLELLGLPLGEPPLGRRRRSTARTSRYSPPAIGSPTNSDRSAPSIAFAIGPVNVGVEKNGTMHAEPDRVGEDPAPPPAAVDPVAA